MKINSFLFTCFLACTVFALPVLAQSERINVILDTDIGNDVDDALAVDMLFKYAEQGKVNVLAISNVKNSKFAVPYLDLFNRWYGHSRVPIFTIKPLSDEVVKKKRFTQVAVELQDKGKIVFPRKLNNEDQVEEAVSGLRRTLSRQKDQSVVFISIGFLSNLSRLLQSGPDSYSSLNGLELVKQKVKFLSMMGGDFRGVERTEFNIRYDVPAAQVVFSKWPTPIYTSPFEVGMVIKYPAAIIQSEFRYVKHHPLVVSYENYLTMPYDREAWDLTAVLFAIEGATYFGTSPLGNIEVIGKGKTIFQEDVQGKHRYLTVNQEQQNRILERLIEITTLKPKKYKK